MNDFESKVNRYSLKFHEIEKEKDFNRYLVEKSLLWFKFALLSGVIFFIATGIIDFWLYPNTATSMIIARILLMLPVIIIVILNKNSEWYIKNAIGFNVVAIVLAGFGVLVITFIGRNEELIYINYVGVIISFIYLYTFLRVHFIYCSIIGNLLLISSIIMQITIIDAPSEIVMSNIFYLVIANFICLFTSYLLEYQYRKEYFLKDKMEMMSIEDSLTGLYNRHFYQLVVEKEMNEILMNASEEDRRKRENALREMGHCGIVLIDIDYFKSVNDNYGHNVGDKVLVQFAEILKKNIRSTDYVIRWGGEEFLIAIPSNDSHHIKEYTKRIGEYVSNYDFKVDHLNLNITCSIGAVNVTECNEFDLTKIIAMADEKLYKAKNSGRNRGYVTNCVRDQIEETIIEF